MRLLIAEDDKALSLFLRRGLETRRPSRTHRPRRCQGRRGLPRRIARPDDSRSEYARQGRRAALGEMRQLNADLPVLVLTGAAEVDTRVRCLDSGADDLMTKPFSLSELRARCRALLRRKREGQIVLRAGDLEINRLDHSVRRAGRTLSLTNKEFALLEHLMLNRGRCVSRVELLETSGTWNPCRRPTLSMCM